MTNGDIAAAFERIAKILALQGENPFRIAAYERAAVIIASLPKDLGALYRSKGARGLTEIPGIGKDLAGKIEEMLRTGKLAFLAALEKKVPAGLLAITDIQGMGPRRTRALWKKFRVRSVADLERLAASGKLSAVKGWGKKSAENVLRGILFHRASAERRSLPMVLPLAEELVAAMRATKLCANLDLAGSLRRRRETVGDIDILATGSRPTKIMKAFCGLPQVERVLAQGTTRSSVRLRAGLNADLRVVEPKVYGAALYYFTGSKEHNVRLRGLATKRGLTVSEYGVHRGTPAKKGRLLAAATEQDVLRSVGLPYIPPELREDRGEIEAASAGALPTLIEESDLRGDLHMHSVFSDGASSMITMARAAADRGFDYIAITDHASPMGMVKGLKPGNVAEYLRLIGEARRAVPGLRILAGTEVDILEDGALYLPDEVLAKLDWVIAAVHGSFGLPRERMTERLLRAVRHPLICALAHPTARHLGKRPPIAFDEDRVFAAAAEHRVALELNASIFRLDLNDVLCKKAKESGATIVVGSDAHHPREFDYAFAVGQARRGWLEKSDVLNAWPWSRVSKFLSRSSRAAGRG